MDLFDIVSQKIQKSSIFQPILFVWNNRDKLDIELNNLIWKLFSTFEVDKNNIYKLEDDGETIKIDVIRNFIAKSNVRSSYKFQIFLIENISRFTLQSANATLKFLEEPWDGNIIFLTNSSESWILETILSRVSIVNIFWKEVNKKNDFYYDLINNFVFKKSNSLLYYFFDDKKIQKEDYLAFLHNLIIYIKENLVFIDLLSDIENAINLVEKNSVSPKYLVDRIIINLQKYEI